MLKVNYAYRDDEKNIALLTQDAGIACDPPQIIGFRKREFGADFVGQYVGIDLKGPQFPQTALTQLGKTISVTDKYRRCVLVVESQIEFIVRPRVLQELSPYFPAYNSSTVYSFFEGQPSGFISILRVYLGETVLPKKLLVKGRQGSAQIIRLYDLWDEPVEVELSDRLIPIVEDGYFYLLKDEIIHLLRKENALVGVYESNAEGKALLRKKREAFLQATGQYKHSYNEDSDIDRSLTDYEEIYSQVLELAPAMHDFVQHIRQVKAPQMVEWQTLLPRAQAGDQSARHRIVEMYTRNVLRIALYFSKRYWLPFEEVFQDGMVGLLLAVDKFNTISSDVFPTYFPLWVRQVIQRRSATYDNSLYFPHHIYVKMQAIKEYALDKGLRFPEDHELLYSFTDDIAKSFELSFETATQLIDYLLPVLSYDYLCESFEDGFEEHFCLYYEEETQILDRLANQQLSQIILDLLNSLRERESDILKQRNGFTGNGVKTLEEVGIQYGLTRERIRQIEDKALQKLRHPSRAKRIKNFYTDG